MSDSLWPHGLQYAKLPCSPLSPRVYSSSGPLSWWGHPTISSSVASFSSCPQSYPVSGSFPVNQLFTSGGQSNGIEGRHGWRVSQQGKTVSLNLLKTLVCMLSCFSRVRLYAIPWTVPGQVPLSMGFSSKNTGVGCHVLLQGIFPTQGSNPCLLCLLHWQEVKWTYLLERLILKLKRQYFGHRDSLEDPDAGKDWGQDKKRATEWKGWMASLTQWTWVWVNSRSWWWIGRPQIRSDQLLSHVGLLVTPWIAARQGGLSDWTELNWTEGSD